MFAIYKLMATSDETAELARMYRAGGMGYGEAKKRLAEVFERVLGPARERREALAKDPSYVEDVMRTSARKARGLAQSVMEDVRSACGIVTAKT